MFTHLVKHHINQIGLMALFFFLSFFIDVEEEKVQFWSDISSISKSVTSANMLRSHLIVLADLLMLSILFLSFIRETSTLPDVIRIGKTWWVFWSTQNLNLLYLFFFYIYNSILLMTIVICTYFMYFMCQ